MSSQIQRKNHKIHPCNSEKKDQLLNLLISQFPNKNILIISTNKTPSIAPSATLTLITDNEMKGDQKDQYDILISYDLPQKALTYMTRFAHAKEMALILLDNEDQKYLYGIETLLGRTITQESITGFEPSFGIAVEQENKAKARERRRVRDEEEALKAQKWAKKDKDKPVFLGTDETGKAIFSKKSRERNHYIDGTPRTNEEKSTKTKYESKPVFFGDKAHLNKPKNEDFKKPYGDKKKEFDDKKPFGDKKPYGDKKKEFGDKKSFTDKKPYNNNKASSSRQEEKPTSSRIPKTINVKSLKPKEAKE
jgi:ATP-dependent RNA helicase RhlE